MSVGIIIILDCVSGSNRSALCQVKDSVVGREKTRMELHRCVALVWMSIGVMGSSPLQRVKEIGN